RDIHGRRNTTLLATFFHSHRHLHLLHSRNQIEPPQTTTTPLAPCHYNTTMPPTRSHRHHGLAVTTMNHECATFSEPNRDISSRDTLSPPPKSSSSRRSIILAPSHHNASTDHHLHSEKPHSKTQNRNRHCNHRGSSTISSLSSFPHGTQTAKGNPFPQI
ncbi:hypothetical protein VIGAN_02343400, partial [Vigna angularis var. angularis]